MLLRFAPAICFMAPLFLFADAEQQTKAALSALADPNSEQAIGLWNALGTIHQSQSKLSEAERDYRRALALNHGANSATEASILNNLATLFQARRDYKAADVLLRQGYELLKKKSLTEAVPACPLLANLALNYQELGQLSEAEQKYHEAQKIFERPELKDTVDRALFLSNFGLLDFGTGHYSEGLLHGRQAVELIEKLPVGSMQQRAYVLNNVGSGLTQAGHLAEAETFYQRSVACSTGVRLIESLSNLATLQEKLGRYAEAKANEEQAEKIAQGSLSPDEPIWATIWNNLGLIAYKQGDKQEARIEYERSAALWLRTLGPNNAHYASTLANIAG